MKPINHSQTQILLRSQKGPKDFYNSLNNTIVKNRLCITPIWSKL